MARCKNKCSICNKPFNEEDKVVLNAHAVVMSGGGYFNSLHKGTPIKSDTAQIRFKSGQFREVSHLSCVLKQGENN